MATRLQQEIRQTRPFESLEQEALLSIERTAALLGHELADMLAAHDVTPAQYNVLRILRGAGSDGLHRAAIRERMVRQEPDVTRLLDRLEAAGLIARARSDSDRRQVDARITRAGLALLRALDASVAAFHERQLGHLSRAKLRALIDLLAEARDGR